MKTSLYPSTIMLVEGSVVSRKTASSVLGVIIFCKGNYSKNRRQTGVTYLEPKAPFASD